MIKDLIEQHRQRFVGLCQQHRVVKLYAFGSSVHGPFTGNSDVDLIVEVEQGEPVETGERLWSFWDRMEELLQRRVDLLTTSQVKNPVRRKSIEAGKRLIYDGSSGSLL